VKGGILETPVPSLSAAPIRLAAGLSLSCKGCQIIAERVEKIREKIHLIGIKLFGQRDRERGREDHEFASRRTLLHNHITSKYIMRDEEPGVRCAGLFECKNFLFLSFTAKGASFPAHFSPPGRLGAIPAPADFR
jgi:hypothetical protein